MGLGQFDVELRSVLRQVFFNRKGIRSGWRLLAWMALSLAGLFVAAIVVAVLAAAAGVGLMHAHTMPLWLTFAATWLLFVPLFLAAAVVAVTMERRPIGSLGFGFHSRWLMELLRGSAWGLGTLCLVMLLLVCTGGYRIHGFHEGFVPAVEWGLLMAAGFLGVGVVEEFLGRGYLLQNLIDGLGLPAAATISCLLFMAMHIPNAGENPIGLLQVLLAGILLVVLILRTRSLWMAVGFHAAWDWAQNFLFGVADSGTVTPGGLLNSTPHGPAWLSGGAAGPEGSVVALAVVALTIVYFARAPWLTAAPDAALLWRRFVSPREEPAGAEAAQAQSPDFDLDLGIGRDYPHANP